MALEEMSPKTKKEGTRPLQARIRASLYRRAEEAAALDHRSLTGLTQMLIERHLNDAPQATNAYELWLLRASRAVRATDQVEWARSLRGLVGAWKMVGGGMEEELYAALGEISREGEEQRTVGDDRGSIRSPRYGRAPKAR